MLFISILSSTLRWILGSMAKSRKSSKIISEVEHWEKYFCTEAERRIPNPDSVPATPQREF
jgi:hypothetical protein